jgi:cyclopropane-fatty-acyl-phospholipid synthase
MFVIFREHHAQWARAHDAERVLDIGCGSGAVLRHLVEEQGVRHAVGLTLSQEQAEWIAFFNHPRIEVHLDSWTEHAGGSGDGNTFVERSINSRSRT